MAESADEFLPNWNALVLDTHLVDGPLRRTSRGGEVGTPAGDAADFGNLAEGLLILHQATAEPRWLVAAGELLEVAVAHFGDEAGGFFDTADDAERLVRRPRDPTDNASPSGASALIAALVAYSALTESLVHRERAEAALATVENAPERLTDSTRFQSSSVTTFRQSLTS